LLLGLIIGIFFFETEAKGLPHSFIKGIFNRATKTGALGRLF
jgi:hypothetical protein